MEIIIGIILLIILFPLLLVNIKSNDIDFNGNDFEILYKAKMLLKYCLEHNIDVPEEIIESLTIDTDYDKLNDHQRKNVWLAYNELNKLIKEISVENVFNVVYHKRQSNIQTVSF